MNGETVAFFGLLWLVVTAVVHVLFAVGVYRSASTLRFCDRQVWFAPPILWALATLAGGVVVAGLYWLIHHSRIRTRPVE